MLRYDVVCYDMIRYDMVCYDTKWLPGLRSGDGGHEVRQTLLELNADALRADGAPSRAPAAPYGRPSRGVVAVVSRFFLLACLQHLANQPRQPHRSYY